MKNYNVMIKPASSLCNMRCKYCFYADVAEAREVCSFGIMTDEVMASSIENIRRCVGEGDRVNFVFQGGEPTLAGVDFITRFVERTSAWQGVTVTYALQTNAVLINEEWCQLLKAHSFLVGVSLDVLEDAHDSVRLGADGGGTYKAVLSAIEMLKRHKIDFNVLCTLTGYVARHPREVYKQLKRLGIDYVQFTPCLDDFDGKSPYAITPKGYASFYTVLFDLWYEDYKKGKYVSVKLFEDVINQLVLRTPTICGGDGKCRPQLVVEADGSTYPCDFYCLDKYKLGNLTSSSVDELLHSKAVTDFVSRKTERPDLCDKCRYSGFCGGNCARMRHGICVGEDKSFCGFKAFLDKCGGTLTALARSVLSRR